MKKMEVTMSDNNTLLMASQEMVSAVYVLNTVQFGFLTVTSLTGLLGNLLVIVVVSLSRSLHNVTSVFVVLLAASDISVCTAVIPMSGLALMANRTWPMSDSVCVAAGVAYVMFRWTSILTLMLISVERCIGIRLPLHYPKILTPRVAAGLITVVVCYALFIALLPTFGLGRYGFSTTKGLCAPDYAASHVHTLITLVGSSCLPLCVTLLMYAAIAQVALRTAKRGTIVCDENNCKYVPSKKAEIKAVKTLSIITGVFTMCWMPYIIVNLQSLQLPSNIDIYTDTATECLSLLSSALNPLMYSLLNRAFRLALKKLKAKFYSRVSGNTDLPVSKMNARRQEKPEEGLQKFEVHGHKESEKLPVNSGEGKLVSSESSYHNGHCSQILTAHTLGPSVKEAREGTELTLMVTPVSICT